MDVDLISINPALDVVKLAAEFEERGRVQVVDFLTAESARLVHSILVHDTRWEVAWQAGKEAKPQVLAHAELVGPQRPARLKEMMEKSHTAIARGDFAFRYGCYPIIRGLLDRRDPDGPYDRLIAEFNTPAVLDFARRITGDDTLFKADAQATVFAPDHFLGMHDDTGSAAEGRKVAYVLGFAPADWHPDWGGYLQFYDGDGNICWGWKPRYNVLNLMTVPCAHSVSYVPPFAPNARFSITGWFRDR